jgi:hypothetical protein
MAIMDSKLELCDAQSIAGVASYSLASTNAINLGTGYTCWDETAYNENEDLWLNVAVATTFTPAAIGPAATTIYLKTATTAAVAKTAAGTTVRSWAFEANSLQGSMVAGQTLIRERLPKGYHVTGQYKPLSQFIALWFANNATIITAGAIDAWLSVDGESELPRS